MKIACLLRSLEMGGLERQLTGLASFLKQEGHDVIIIKYLDDNFYGDFVSGHRIPVVHLKRSGGNIGMGIKLAGYIKRHGIDMVIAFGASPNLKACIAKSIYGNFKLIVSERNYNIRWWPTDYIRFIAYRQADAIVSNSVSQGNLIRRKFSGGRLGGVAEKSCTIVNFTDHERFAPSQKENDAKEPLRIITTGRVVRRKNVHGYIKAAHLLRSKGHDFRMEWHGLGVETAYYRRCMRLIKRYGLEEVFRIFPARKRVEDIYSTADVFCLPSFYEGTSNAISEALSCGLPVICSTVSDNTINVEEGRNGWLFDPTDIRSMTDAFERMLGSTEECRKTYGRNSRSIAVNRLSADRFTRQYKELIDRIQGQFHRCLPV